MGWSHYAHARQSDSRANISWTTGIGKTSAMWAIIAVQRCSEGQSEAVWHRPVGPGWRHLGSLSLENSICAMKQSPSSKILESKLWHIKEQFGRGLNASTSQQPQRLAMWQLLSRLQFQNWTPRSSTNSPMTSDLSFFDGAVRSVPSRASDFLEISKAVETSNLVKQSAGQE